MVISSRNAQRWVSLLTATPTSTSPIFSGFCEDALRPDPALAEGPRPPQRPALWPVEGRVSSGGLERRLCDRQGGRGRVRQRIPEAPRAVESPGVCKMGGRPRRQ